MIFDHIEKAIGTEKAPKICGMLIDLPSAELYDSLISLEILVLKCRLGLDLLTVAQKEKEAQEEVKNE